MAKKVTVKKVASKKEVVKLDPKKSYTLVLDKDTKHMKKGSYVVDGAMAEVLLNKGIGVIK